MENYKQKINSYLKNKCPKLEIRGGTKLEMTFKSKIFAYCAM